MTEKKWVSGVKKTLLYSGYNLFHPIFLKDSKRGPTLWQITTSKSRHIQFGLGSIAGQPTPPNVPPPRNKDLIRPYLNKALLNPYFWGGGTLGGVGCIAMKKHFMISHIPYQGNFKMIFLFQWWDMYGLHGYVSSLQGKTKHFWLKSWLVQKPELSSFWPNYNNSPTWKNLK